MTRTPTRFTSTLAADAWDAWFRWRGRDTVRDMTIDETWHRVACGLAAAEGAAARRWEERFRAAFTEWRVLPDDRLLCCLGTGAQPALDTPISAQVNAGAFLRTLGDGRPRFLHERFDESAALAVRMLGDAALVLGAPAHAIRVGLMGVGDALAGMGLDYDSDAGRDFAADLARRLGRAALAASVELAVERGAQVWPGEAQLAGWCARGVPPALVDQARVHGLRHYPVTEVQSQPRLAVFANEASDALDPSRHQLTALLAGDPARLLLAQLKLRAAVAPFLDRPLACPLLSAREPQAAVLEDCRTRARSLGLPDPQFQFLGTEPWLP